MLPIMHHFRYDHLPQGHQRVIKPFKDLADWMVANLPRDPERSIAIRKVLEAKDAALRAYFAGGSKEIKNKP